jgi:hypothetical protein
MVKLTPNEFTERARRVHKNRYDYSKFMYVDSKTKGIIVCHIHGRFLQTPNGHLMGHGCDLCGHSRAGKMKRVSSSEFIRKAVDKHGKVYDYSNANYTTALKKVSIICPTHGEFLQNPRNHLLGKGCPKCHTSKGERKIIQIFTDNKVKYELQKTFSDCKNPKTNYKLRFDFYIPSRNLLIEYDGEQHFSTGYIGGNYFTNNNDLKELKFRDRVKTSYAVNNNIPLLRITFKDFNNIENILLPRL